MKITVTITSCFIAFSPVLSWAQSDGDEGPLSATLSVGYESDDNVTTSELDTSSGISDEAMVIDFGLALSLGNESLGIELGYDFSQTDYDTQDAFDIE